MIFDEYKKSSEGYVVNISQAITFVFKQLRKICTNIQAQRSMKRLEYGFCNKIVQIPLSYGEERHSNKNIIGLQREIIETLEPRNNTF